MIHRSFLILACILCTACSPLYVARAAVEQISILTSRQPIEKVIQDPSTPEETKQKLDFIRQAKQFSETIGLASNGSFSSYVDIGRNELSWIVMGSQKTSFKMHTWWFPIVGTVPYKGFFEREDAQELAQELESEGFETWVRPTDAYSTLGWFDDPVLSPLLKRSIPELVETVIHEQFHATHWVKGNVPLNETAAQIVGLAGAIAFFEQSSETIKALYLNKAKENLERAKNISWFINELYSALSKVYDDTSLDDPSKLRERDRVFEEFIAPFKLRNPSLKGWDKPNNAQIQQTKTYYTNFDSLHRLYESTHSVKDFINALGEKFKKCQDDSECL